MDFDGLVVKLAGELCGCDIAGELQQHRAQPAVLQMRHRASDHFRDALRNVDGRRPLGDTLVVGNGLEVGVDALTCRRVAAGDRKERHGVCIALCHAAECVFRAGAGLHGEYANLLAVVDAAEPVRHVDARALLPAQDGADALTRACVNEGLRREAGKPFHAFRLQYFCHCFVAVQCMSPLDCGFAFRLVSISVFIRGILCEERFVT